MWVVILIDGEAMVCGVSGHTESREKSKTFARGWAHQLADAYRQDNGVLCTVEVADTTVVYDPDGEEVWEFVVMEVK